MTRAAYAQTAHRYTARTHRLLVLRDQVVAPMLADVLAHDLGDPRRPAPTATTSNSEKACAALRSAQPHRQHLDDQMP
jgi:hypothetical protein